MTILKFTDFLGLRVICYILSDVEKVKEIVEKYFKVIGRADDKTQDLGTDRFGYRSVHYTVSISKARHSLPEYGSYKDLKFEIQIRTILALTSDCTLMIASLHNLLCVIHV